jgi:hypothetical protein
MITQRGEITGTGIGCGGGVIAPPPRLGRCACASDVTTTKSKMQTREMEMGELVFMNALS